MLISRGVGLCKTIARLQGPTKSCTTIQTLRNSGTWVYRVGAAPASKKTLFMAEFVSGFMWWWILWHLWHEPEHITGEFPYPDPSKWTDAELGIS